MEQAKYLRYLPWVGTACAVVLIGGTVSPNMEPIDRINAQQVAAAWPGFGGQAPPLSVPESSGEDSSSDALGGAISDTGASSDLGMAGGDFGDAGGGSGSDAVPPSPPAAPGGVSSGSGFGGSPGGTGGMGGGESAFEKATYDTTIGSSAFGVYEKIPGLLQQGVAFSSVRTRKDYLRTEGECESFGAGYWLGYAVEEGVLGDQASPDEAPSAVAYKNPMHARATYPKSSRNTEPVPPSSPVGPHWTAECESLGGDGNGTYTNLSVPEAAISVGQAVSKTTSEADEDTQKVVSETYAALNDLRIGDAVVGSVSSKFEVETDMKTNKPTVTYRIRIMDVRNGSDTVLGHGDDGLTLAGTNVPSSDLHSQFNKQIDQNENAVSDIGTVGLRLLEPRVEEEFGVIDILSGALTVRNTVAEREGMIGGEQGFALVESRFTNGATH